MLDIVRKGLTVSFEPMAAGESSFDVVSEFDRQELVNALDQALREVRTRFDLKDSGTTIELDGSVLKLHSASEMTLEASRDVLLQKAVRRQLSPKIFDYGRVEEASKGTVRQSATLRQGLSQDLSREIVRLIRERLPKLKTQIQGDAVRVTGKNKEDLQVAIQLLRKMEQERNWPVPLQFVNYRS
jgi:uncharacterized protein YajQ (UPF0234 family)